jgi:hypothetical protein
MTLPTSDDRVEAILEDLAHSARRPGTLPVHRMVVLGKFVEEIHKTLGLFLGFDSDKVKIDAWHLELSKLGEPVHASLYQHLHAIYGWRNISGHSNTEQHAVTNRRVLRDLEEVTESFTRLVTFLPAPGLLDTFLKVQTSNKRLLHAEKLREALEVMAGPTGALKKALAYALPLLAPKQRGFLKAPPERQLRQILTQLAAYAVDGNDGHLVRLAEYLDAELPPNLDRAPLHKWARGMQAMAVGAGDPHERLSVIRARIDEDPETPGGLVLRSLRALTPEQDVYSVTFREPFAGVDDLAVALVEPLGRLQQVLARVQACAVNTEHFVLQIEVPPTLACASFESSLRRKVPLFASFRCVVVRPLLESRLARTLQATIAHPTANDNCIALWERVDLPELCAAVAQKDCYFVGPAHWDSAPQIDRLAAGVEAFDQVCIGVLAQDVDREGFLDRVFGVYVRRPIGDLLDTITALRRSGERMVVLWDDLAYEPPRAEVV